MFPLVQKVYKFGRIYRSYSENEVARFCGPRCTVSDS